MFLKLGKSPIFLPFHNIGNPAGCPAFSLVLSESKRQLKCGDRGWITAQSVQILTIVFPFEVNEYQTTCNRGKEKNMLVVMLAVKSIHRLYF